MNIIIDGMKISCRRAGVGGDFAVLLLHGWGSDMSVFDGVFGTLSKSFETIAVDLPGFGKSDEPKESFCVDDYVDIVVKLLMKLSVRRVALVGHSYGGRVIIKLCTRAKLPFEIDRVVLVDSAGVKPHKSLMKRFKGLQYKVAKRILSTDSMKTRFPNGLDELRERYGSKDFNAASPVMRETLSRSVEEDLTGLLPMISQPTFIVWGDKDTATPLSDGKTMANLIPNAGMFVIEGGGHFSLLDNRAVFSAGLMSFLLSDEVRA